MSNLFSIAQSDSFTSGAEASTKIEPPQLSNATDDCIMLRVQQSANSQSSITNATYTTPPGYTLLIEAQEVELKMLIFYKRSEGGEQIPHVTSSLAANWCCTTAIISDVDWDSGGVHQYARATSNGDTKSPNIVTSSNGSGSAFMCFYGLERREIAGLGYPVTRPQTVKYAIVSTGENEGEDNSAAVASDFVKARDFSFAGPKWEAKGNGNSIAINVEILTKGNIIPLQVIELISENAPDFTEQTSMEWVKKLLNGGKLIDGSSRDIKVFGKNAVHPDSNEIHINDHGMDESAVYRFSSSAAPGGLTDGDFYYVEPTSASRIRLRTFNENASSPNAFYNNDGSKRPIVEFSNQGGDLFMMLEEVRIINSSERPLGPRNPPRGDTSDTSSSSGNYNGDAGYNQNDIAAAIRFDDVFDATNKLITFSAKINTGSRLSRACFTVMDDNDNWISWKLRDQNIENFPGGDVPFQFEVSNAAVQALAFASHGTFDASKMRYAILNARGNNTSVQRLGAVESTTDGLKIGGPFSIVGGTNATFEELTELASYYTTQIVRHSDLQIGSALSLKFGDGTEKISFVDSEKSVAFPPLANGTTLTQNYIETIKVDVHATADSTMKLTNSSIGASSPFKLDVQGNASSDVDFNGNTYVRASVDLTPNFIYENQFIVGGNGVKHNNAIMRDCTFMITEDTGADNGMVEWSSGTRIENSIFQLRDGVNAGHAIIINSPGVYNFKGLTFKEFAANNYATTAVYNASDGNVVLNIFDGVAPTVRNSINSTTTINVLKTLKLENLQAGSKVRILEANTTNIIAGDDSVSTTFTANLTASSVDIVIVKPEYEYLKISAANTSSNLTLPIEQIVDKNFQDSSAGNDVEFDGVNTKIQFPTIGNFNVQTDMYSAWKRWLMLDDNAKYKTAFDTAGGDDVGGDQEVAPYFFARNDLGWRIRMPEADGEIVAAGNLFPRDPNTELFEQAQGFDAFLRLEVSTRAVVIGHDEQMEIIKRIEKMTALLPDAVSS